MGAWVESFLSISIVCASIPLVYLASESYPDTLYPIGVATYLESVLSVVVCVVAYVWMVRHRKF